MTTGTRPEDWVVEVVESVVDADVDDSDVVAVNPVVAAVVLAVVSEVVSAVVSAVVLAVVSAVVRAVVSAVVSAVDAAVVSAAVVRSVVAGSAVVAASVVRESGASVNFWATDIWARRAMTRTTSKAIEGRWALRWPADRNIIAVIVQSSERKDPGYRPRSFHGRGQGKGASLEVAPAGLEHQLCAPKTTNDGVYDCRYIVRLFIEVQQDPLLTHRHIKRKDVDLSRIVSTQTLGQRQGG